MGYFIFIASFLLLIAYFDVAVRVRAVLSRAWAKRYADRMAGNISRIVFAVSRRYLNHRIYFHTNIPLAEIPKSFILISNHQSIVDIPTLLSCFPGFKLRFVAKNRLFRGVPLISIMLRLQKHGIIYRGDSRRKSYDELKLFARRCSSGQCPVVFPEGTRSETGILQPFSTGALRAILREIHLPIVTVAMDGGWVVSKAGQLATNLKNCIYRVGVLNIHVPPSSRSGLNEAINTYRDEIAEQLKIWRGVSRY